jgi:predicted transcriptional regulator
MAKCPDDDSAASREVFVISDDHLAGVLEGLAEVEHGKFASDEDMAALWEKCGL